MIAKFSTIWLLVCGAVAGPLFIATFLVEGFTRAHYNPLRHTVSTLELGQLGWIQITNFLLAGMLTLAFVIGLRRILPRTGIGLWGPLLLGAWGLALIAAGIFITDPVSGYPPGTGNGYQDVHGVLHDVFAVPGFLCLLGAQGLFGRWFARSGRRRWAIYSSASALAFCAGFVAYVLAVSPGSGLEGLGGLFQRLFVSVGWTWQALLAVQFAIDTRAMSRSDAAGVVLPHRKQRDAVQ